MYILLEGHNIKKDLEELIRICFGTRDFIYLESMDDYKNKGRLFYNKIVAGENGEKCISHYYEDGIRISSWEKNISDINVYIDSQNKKRNVAIKQSLISLSGKEYIAWGILTGIRPVKILHDLMDKNISYKEIRRVLEKDYLIDRKKVDLLLSIAKIQRPIIEENIGKYSIYISIPFCPTRCSYCSFPSLPIKKHGDWVEKYVDTLIYELKETSKGLDLDRINTVYIGGGTPSSIRKDELERIILTIREIYGDRIKEFTVEAGRPDTLDEEYLRMLKRNGVDRISINPQTMNDETLHLIGREHSSEDIMDIYNIARSLDFDSINMDLIVGLPGEGIDELAKSLEKIEILDPDNLTIHSLAIKTGSSFENKISGYRRVDSSQIEEIELLIEDYIKRNQLEAYYLYRQKRSLAGLENVGYAKRGKICKYNISMMEERETVFAFGMGAVSKILGQDGRIKRVPNFNGLNDYIDRIDELIDRKLES